MIDLTYPLCRKLMVFPKPSPDPSRRSWLWGQIRYLNLTWERGGWGWFEDYVQMSGGLRQISLEDLT